MSGSIGVELTLKNGRLESLTLSQAKGLIPGLTSWVSATLSWPHSLRESLYSVNIKDLNKVYNLISNWPSENDCPLLRPISILLKTRIPPIINEEYNISEELELNTGIPIEINTTREGKEDTLLRLSLGELSKHILESSTALAKVLHDEYSLMPLIFIDDGFDGIPASYSGFLINTLSEALNYSTITITTYRPEAIVLSWMIRRRRIS